jgi:hypothetical protein
MINILRNKHENISTAENSQPTVSSHGDVEDILINVSLYVWFYLCLNRFVGAKFEDNNSGYQKP